MYIFDKHKLSFYISPALWLWKYDGFDFWRDPTIEVLFGWEPSSWFSTLPSFGGHGLCECGDKTFWLDTLPCDWCVTWLCRWSPLILSNHPAKLGVHRPCESKNITFFSFVTWPQYWSATWLCGRHPLILSHQLAKFGVHRPCESGNITFFICHVTTITKCQVNFWVGSPHPKSPPS